MKELIAQNASELITGIIAVLLGWFGKTKMSKKVEDAELTKLVQGIYKDMIADTLTKVLPRCAFSDLKDKMRVIPSQQPTIVEGN